MEGDHRIDWFSLEEWVFEDLVSWIQSLAGCKCFRSIYSACMWFFLETEFSQKKGKICGFTMNKCVCSFTSITELEYLYLDMECIQFFSVSQLFSVTTLTPKAKGDILFLSQIWVIMPLVHGLFKLSKYHILMWKQFHSYKAEKSHK